MIVCYVTNFEKWNFIWMFAKLCERYRCDENDEWYYGVFAKKIR